MKLNLQNVTFYVYQTSVYQFLLITNLVDVFWKWSSTANCLGVILNTKLTWGDQCAYVAASKASRLLNLLWQSLFACSSVAKNRAFQSLIIPILEHDSQVWNPSTQKNSKKLETVQLHAAHWLTSSHFNQHTFKWSKPSLECCIDLHRTAPFICHQHLSILTAYDILHGRIALKFSSYFPFTSKCTLPTQCKLSWINS